MKLSIQSAIIPPRLVERGLDWNADANKMHNLYTQLGTAKVLAEMQAGCTSHVCALDLFFRKKGRPPLAVMAQWADSVQECDSVDADELDDPLIWQEQLFLSAGCPTNDVRLAVDGSHYDPRFTRPWQTVGVPADGKHYSHYTRRQRSRTSPDAAKEARDGAWIRNRGLEIPLTAAVRSGDAGRLQRVIESGHVAAVIDDDDDDEDAILGPTENLACATTGETALHVAAACARADMVALLLDAGLFGVDERDEFGATPLTYLAHAASEPVRIGATSEAQVCACVDALLARGADVDALNTVSDPLADDHHRGEFATTALGWAARAWNGAFLRAMRGRTDFNALQHQQEQQQGQSQQQHGQSQRRGSLACHVKHSLVPFGAAQHAEGYHIDTAQHADGDGSNEGHASPPNFAWDYSNTRLLRNDGATSSRYWARRRFDCWLATVDALQHGGARVRLSGDVVAPAGVASPAAVTMHLLQRYCAQEHVDLAALVNRECTLEGARATVGVLLVLRSLGQDDACELLDRLVAAGARMRGATAFPPLSWEQTVFFGRLPTFHATLYEARAAREGGDESFRSDKHRNHTQPLPLVAFALVAARSDLVEQLLAHDAHRGVRIMPGFSWRDFIELPTVLDDCNCRLARRTGNLVAIAQCLGVSSQQLLLASKQHRLRLYSLVSGMD